MSAIDITGQRFGALAAVEKVRATPAGFVWRFACDCGGATERLAAAVRFAAKKGRQQVCGHKCPLFAGATGETFRKGGIAVAAGRKGGRKRQAKKVAAYFAKHGVFPFD